MDTDKYEKMLEWRGIKPTAIRILVLKALADSENKTMSMPDLEMMLDTVDKSTIFRTITMFLSKHLIHCVDDGSGSLKYAVCSKECGCSIKELHTHFYCTECHSTFCMKGQPIPPVNLPEGFKAFSANYVLKGLCPLCSEKLEKQHCQQQ